MEDELDGDSDALMLYEGEGDTEVDWETLLEALVDVLADPEIDMDHVLVPDFVVDAISESDEDCDSETVKL